MAAMDLSQVSDAVRFIVSTAAPYVAGKVAEGGMKAMGADTYRTIRDKAVSVWSRIKTQFQGDVMVQAALQQYEQTKGVEKSREDLTYALTSILQRQPDTMKELVPLLQELQRILPSTRVTSHGPQTVSHVTNSTVIQIQGDQNSR